MDPSKCLAILHARNTSVDPEKEEFYKASFPETDDAPSAELTPPCEIDILIAMDTISLMNIITTLQGERVQVYIDFDESLKLLTKESRLGEYPNLCAEVTSRFSVLSKKIKTIKDIFATRDTKDIVDSINDIQLLEKEKLLLVAAQHLDKMHLSIPSLGANMGNLSLTTTETNSKYAIDKMRQLEQKISESLENFQSLKCDYSEM